MKVLGLSGGSTKGIGTLGICEELSKKGVKWDLIVGVSVGAILAVPIAMEYYSKPVTVFKTLDLDDMFKVNPVKKNGKFSLKGLFYLLKNKLAIGDMSNVKKLVSSIITEEVFNQYKEGDYAECISVSVDLVTGKRHYVRAKESTYEEYLNGLLASASIPIFTLPVIYNNKVLFDGGVRDHVANHLFLENATECWTIFTRPEYPRLNKWKPKSIVDILQRTIDIMNIEISKNDEKEINRICKEKNITNHKLYLPTILNSLYDTDNDRLNELYEAGKCIGKKFKFSNNFFVKK